VTNFALSYAMEPYRPRLCFTKVREIWAFSIWSLCTRIGEFLSNQSDRVAIGGFAGAAAMGRYYVATDVATSPSKELVGPMVQVMFPVMAAVQHDSEKRRELYLTVLYWSALICTSTAIGVALIADDMVDLVLGSQWEDVKPLMPWLALSYGVLGMGSSVYTALNTINQPRVSARLQWTRLIGTASTIFPVAYYFRDLEAVAATRLLVTIAITPTLFFALMKPFGLSARDFAVTLWRPLTAGLMMALVVLGLNSAISFAGSLRLLIDMAAGAIAYGGTLMALWVAIGQPDGPERAIWQRAVSIASRCYSLMTRNTH